MSVSFNSIPSANRVPFVFVEFDNTAALQGVNVQPFKALMLGQKIAAGTAVADTPVLVTSEDQAKNLFGAGSVLHLMCKTWFKNNPYTQLTVIPQVDAGAGVAATGTIAFAGTSTEAGTLSLNIGGKAVPVAVTSGMAAADLATAVGAAITADTELPVTASVNTTTVNLTAKNKGTCGNEVDIRLNYYVGEKTPAGITPTITAMASGATNPTLTAALAAAAGTHYHVVANPYLDSTSLTALVAEMATRWGPTVQQEGMLFSSKSDTLGNMTTWGLDQNSQFLSVIDLYKSPTPAFRVAAAYAAVAAYYLAIDPARPLQTLPLKDVLPPDNVNRRTLTEQNTLLYSGVATSSVDAGGNVTIQRAITTYQKNGQGAADSSYLDVTTIYTLAFIRYDLRTMLQVKFPRHKLANDGTNFGAGQAVLTPKAAKAEIIAKARQWEELGLVENVDAFKASLVVERSVSDPNRLDVMLLPDLVNQFVVAGVQIKFIL